MQKKQSGFNLIEVLISLLLLSLVLLGFESMEVSAIRASHAAYFFTVATNQMQNLYERLFALKDLQNLSEQIQIWNQQNKFLFPQAKSEVVGQYPSYSVNICWGHSECIKSKINL